MSLFVSIIATVIILYLGQNLTCLLFNRCLAIKSGIPYVLVPFEINLLYNIFARTPVFPVLVDRILLSLLTRWKDCVKPDWRWRQKYALHKKQGNIVLKASPGGICLTSPDASVVHEVLQTKSEDAKNSKFVVFFGN
jgi:hypothetical protein